MVCYLRELRHVQIMRFGFSFEKIFNFDRKSFGILADFQLSLLEKSFVIFFLFLKKKSLRFQFEKFEGDKSDSSAFIRSKCNVRIYIYGNVKGSRNRNFYLRFALYRPKNGYKVFWG